MKKLIIITIVLAMTLAAGTAQAGIFGRRNRGRVMLPTPAAVAPAPAATARTEGSYRTFSYQPGPVYVAPVYRTAERQPAVGSGFHDAGWKIRGF